MIKKDIQTIENVFAELKQFALHASSSKERENIFRDAQAFLLKIKSGEYQNTDFLNRQSFDTPRRTYEFFNYLKGYHQHALTWSHRLQQLPLDHITSIIDLCPGCSPKLQWALQQVNYKNKLYIIDKSVDATDQLEIIMKIFNAQYEHCILNQDFYHPVSIRADLVTANHILDDLILDDYCVKNSIVLSDVYSSEMLLREVIGNIMQHFDIENFCRNVFFSIHEKLNPQGYLMMTHYAGVTEKALNLTIWTDWVMTVMDRVCEIFFENGYRRIEECEMSKPESETQKLVILRAVP